MLLRTLIAALLLCLFAGGCAPPSASQVWFTPNLASRDMVDLFTEPQAWRGARQSTNVFKFYEAQLTAESPADCPACGPNILPAFEQARAFARLGEWSIAIAVEAPVIKGNACSADVNAARAVEAIRNVHLRHGIVRYVAMDEPLLGAQACQTGLEEAARSVAAFARQVRAAYPAVRIGDIEPYPHFGVATLTAWMAALRREGAAPAFVHLDVDRARAGRIGSDVPGDLSTLKSLVEAQAVPFGVIFWGADGADEPAYAADVMAWVETVRAAIGVPTHSVFQSWAVSADGRYVVPRNLPEGDPDAWTHTRLIGEGLDVLRSGASPGPR